MYPKWMNRLFLFFDLWGLSTKFTKCTNQLKFNLIIFISHIILASLATINIIFYLIRLDDDKIAQLNDFLKFSVLFVVYWLSMIELHCKQNVQRMFWQYVYFIDRHFCSHNQYKLTNYLNKMKIYFIFVTIAYILFLCRLINDKGSVVFWFSYSFMLIFFKIRSFYYVFYLEFIKNELRIIDHEVVALLNDCNVAQTNSMNQKCRFAAKFYRSRFKWIRQYYGLVCDLCRTVNTMFDWSNIVVILFTFHLILIDVNWAYWKLLNKYQFNINGNFVWIWNMHLIEMKNKAKFSFCFSIPEYNLWFLLLGALIKLTFGSAFDCYNFVNAFCDFSIKLTKFESKLFLRLTKFWHEWTQFTQISVTKRPICR